MVLVAAMFVMPVAAFAEMKIGFVDLAKLSESAPQIKAAQSKIDAEFSSREQELINLQRKLGKQEEKLTKDGAVMSDSERSSLERDILSKRRDLKRSQDEFRDDLNIRKNEMLRQVNIEIGEIIENFARSENYDLIMAQGVMFASERVDITDLILKKLSAGR
ncbi:MAG: OmpH family outer membrane protein [Gammaproteobacteria bacterium]|nr:OmpH family outer membrane protein [Gammaproteobacteria bacterium]MDH5513826.1 OmpH family outer membrane protein [Gammaproteobacteria bacterium]